MILSLRMKRIKGDYNANIIKLQKHRHNLEQQEHERIANIERNRLEQNETNLAIKQIQRKPTPSISEDESSSSSEEDEGDECELPNTKIISKKQIKKTNCNLLLKRNMQQAQQHLASNVAFRHRTTIKK